MSGIACITLSPEGAALFPLIQAGIPEAQLFVHHAAGPPPGAAGFERIADLTAELFPRVSGLIFAAPCGVVVRAVAGCLRHKTTDPAVVVVDVRARWCVSLASGHEGGANWLAFRVANLLGAEPVITTTTEARKNIIVGVGCRRGAGTDLIVRAIREGLDLAGERLDSVRLLASAEIKSGEPGLIGAAQVLGLPLRFVRSDEIRLTRRAFARSPFVGSAVGLPAVAEPCALLAGRRTCLLLPKTILHGVTVAVAREGSPWSASAPDILSTAPIGPNRPSGKPA